MEKRYSVLRIIATIYKVLGILVGLATLIGALGICALGAIGSSAVNSFGRGQTGIGPIAGGFFGALVVLLVGAIYTLTIYAFGEGISLLLALEENTRLTATLLQQSVRPVPAAQVPAPQVLPP